MKIILQSVLSIIFIFLSFSPFSILPFTKDAIKVQITHSHQVNHQVFNHESYSDALDQHGNQESKEADSGHSHQHTHELIIPSAHTFFIQSNSILIVEVNFTGVHPEVKNELPPISRSISSIFRPPIFT